MPAGGPSTWTAEQNCFRASEPLSRERLFFYRVCVARVTVMIRTARAQGKESLIFS